MQVPSTKRQVPSSAKGERSVHYCQQTAGEKNHHQVRCCEAYQHEDIVVVARIVLSLLVPLEKI